MPSHKLACLFIEEKLICLFKMNLHGWHQWLVLWQWHKQVSNVVLISLGVNHLFQSFHWSLLTTTGRGLTFEMASKAVTSTYVQVAASPSFCRNFLPEISILDLSDKPLAVLFIYNFPRSKFILWFPHSRKILTAMYKLTRQGMFKWLLVLKLGLVMT